MPRGKKKGNSESGKKKGRKNEKKAIIEPLPPEQIQEETEEFYMTQIRDLECKFERYQKKCHELEVKNGEYLGKFDELFKQKKNEVYRIKKILDEKTDEIAEVNEHLVHLQQAKDLDKEQFEQQLQQLRTEYQEMKDHITSENLVLGGKLASLEEFKVQRDEIIVKMNALKQELYEQDCLHKENLCIIEQKQVSDKERLKRDTVQRVNSVAAEFRKISNQQMPETTKRMIRENVTVYAQMSKTSDRTTKMVEDSDGLKERERQQRKRIRILEANEKELAKKSVSTHRIIQMLMEKSSIQKEAIAGAESRDEHGKLLDAEIDHLREQLESARTEHLSVSKKNKELEKELGESRAALDKWILLQQRLEKTVLDAVYALQVVFHDSAGDDSSERSSAIGSKQQVAVCDLIYHMTSAVALERGHCVFHSKGGSDVTCGEYSRIASDNFGPYRVVDLLDGRTSRPERRILANLDAFSKKAVNRSVGTQTDGTAKALLIANQLIMRGVPTVRNSFCSSRDPTLSPSLGFLPLVVPVTSNRVSSEMC